MGCLLWVKSLISYTVSITTVLHTIWGLYSSALWRHSAVCTNCTALKGKKFLLTSGKGNMYWQYCGWDATKHHKIRECFSMAMSSKDLLWFANKFRCIQSCDILHMQNIACVYNHWRLIVNISNTRFLILILILNQWYRLTCHIRVYVSLGFSELQTTFISKIVTPVLIHNMINLHWICQLTFHRKLIFISSLCHG